MSMTMVRQYPHPPPPHLQTPPGPYSNYPPAHHPPLTRNGSSFEGHSLSHRPTPQQYAHPLSRHNSYGSQPSDAGTSKPAEHMLRRKTPNGILAAAYDGTSVEHTEKPHATKHILLPVTAESNLPYGMKQDLPLRATGTNRQDAATEWSPSLYFETGSGRTSQHLPQIDSMLNQIPPLQPLLPYQMYGQPYGGFMAPPGQSPLGPTVSNDQGPYGPYWPDGTYTPYQPAAMRDPRFLHHHRQQWAHSQQNPFSGHAYSNHAVPNMTNFQQNAVPYFPHPQAFSTFARPSYDFSPYLQPQPSPSYPLDYQNQSLPSHRTQHPQDLLPSGQSTPTAEQIPVSTPFAEFGPQSMNGQSREKVFAWAHTIYVELLRYLQHTRKSHSHHSNGRVSSRPHIYPKPPRQPGASVSDASISAPKAPERRSSHSGTEAAKRPAISHSRSSSAWSVEGGYNSPQRTWQHSSQLQQTHPQFTGLEPTRTLRRMSGSVAHVQQTLRPDIPPSMTAASALEAITKHCEESKWNWIDGILLGGCFAYALGDYQKAQGWYKHILTLDKE